MPNNKVVFLPKIYPLGKKNGICFHRYAIRQNIKRKLQNKYPRFSTNNLQGEKRERETYRVKGTEEKYHPNPYADLVEILMQTNQPPPKKLGKFEHRL